MNINKLKEFLGTKSGAPGNISANNKNIIMRFKPILSSSLSNKIDCG